MDEEWQGGVESLADAKEWAKELSKNGSLTWVVERWEGNPAEGIPPGCRLRATFPEERREEAWRIWHHSSAFPPSPQSLTTSLG